MIKKYFATMALAALSLVANAQSRPNRLLVHQKSGATAAYRLGSLDSLSFYNIEGEVRADLTFNKYNTGDTGDTIWVAVKKTEACKSYRIDVLPTARVKAYSDDDIARYFEINQGSPFQDDYTNAQLTGFNTVMEKGSNYTVFTLGYDALGTPCEVSRANFTTPAAAVAGNPQVECTSTATTSSITFNLTPNKDVSLYYITIFKKGEAEQQFEQWAPMFGFANIGQMIQQFSGEGYRGNQTKTISQLVPGTDYELYIQPLDRNGNLASLNIIPCATKKMGGTGKSVITITVKDDFQAQSGSYTQTVVYTPNDQTALHRDMIIDKAAFISGSWKGDENKIIEYLQTPNDMDPYWDQYGVDEAMWSVSPATTYVAYSIGQNANGEWGDLVKKEFTTPKVGSAPAKTATIAKRVANSAATTAGKAPAKKTLKLAE